MNWNDTDIGFQPITNHSIFVELTLYESQGQVHQPERVNQCT